MAEASTPALRVLAYHAIRDLAGARIVEPYGTPPATFRRQLDLLARLGCTFVDLSACLDHLHGRRTLPRRAVLLTFDDCYDDFLEHALPLLEERRIPAVAFALSRVRTNLWDEARGAPRLHLLEPAGLLEVERRGVEIGAHARTHPFLTELSDRDLAAEITGTVGELAAMGLRRPRVLAYPYGAHDRRVRDAVAAAGLAAAFTIEPGLLRPGHDPFRIPRFEVVRADRDWRFLLRTLTGGRVRIVPPGLRTTLRRLVRPAARPADGG